MAIAKVVQFPAPSKAQTVTQSTLANLQFCRSTIESLKAELAETEVEVLAALKSGAEIESGPLSASIRVSERRNVSWKHVCERELGAQYAARVLAATKPDKNERVEIEVGR
ncbi:MAG TPA: hypothetical protein VJN90_08590 [Candidatus Acidoferrales bacterium]|nr:hypothetical protein [Candidatus Acidoferrales bacterium]